MITLVAFLLLLWLMHSDVDLGAFEGPVVVSLWLIVMFGMLKHLVLYGEPLLRWLALVPWTAIGRWL